MLSDISPQVINLVMTNGHYIIAAVCRCHTWWNKSQILEKGRAWHL